jgi:hypothetical protein
MIRCLVALLAWSVALTGIAIVWMLLVDRVAARRKTLEPKWSYQEARREIVTALLRSASAHLASDWRALDAEAKRVDAGLPRDARPELDNLHIAFNFLDGWLDASHHRWMHYEGIGRDDWPALARRLADDLEADRSVSSVLVRRHFDLRAA